MRNLAGSKVADIHCAHELGSAGIPVVVADEPNGQEVNARVTGKLGDLTFRRAWYYWVVGGYVPIAMAQEMYADPVGRNDVRVAGHCGCPPPEEWAETYATEGGFVVCVDNYHIDSAEGLAVFVKAAREHGIVERPIVVKGWTVEATEGILREMTDDAIRGGIGRIVAKGRVLAEINAEDPRIVDLVRRCRDAHPGSS